MSTKRVLALVVMVICVIFLFGLVAGTVGVWLIKAPLLNLTDALFYPTQEVLTLADRRLERVDDRLGQAQERLQTAEANIAGMGGELEENSLILNTISQTVGAELAPIVTQIREDASAVRELVEAANETVQNFNNLPFIAAELPGTSALQELVDGIAAAEAALQELRANLQTARVERIQQGVERLTRPLQTAQARLSEVQSAVVGIGERIAETQARMQAIYEQVLFWLNLMPWVVSILFLWLGLGQIVLFRYAFGLYRGASAIPQPAPVNRGSTGGIESVEAAVIQTRTDNEPQAEQTVEPLSSSEATQAFMPESEVPPETPTAGLVAEEEEVTSETTSDDKGDIAPALG
jgi:hypothetical protein